MNRLRNILVPVDFSPSSHAALLQAARLATRNRARLHVLHGMDPMELSEAAEAMKQSAEAFQEIALKGAQAALGRMARRARLPEGTPYKIEVGPVIDLVLKEAEAVSADLVVVGARGTREGSSGAGMTATRVLRKCRTKVMVVNTGRVRPFRRILACVDFSESSREVVAQALRVAQQDRGCVHFLHVFFAPWRRFGFRAPSPAESLRFAEEHRARLHRRLQEWVGQPEGVRVRYTLTDADNPADGIIREARVLETDLIVLGRRGRTTLGYLLLGSTVERLIRKLSCSVLTVQQPGAALPDLSG